VVIPVEVAPPGVDDRYDERYALQVLTNRPTAFHFFWDLDVFNRVVADQTPTVWLTDNRLANPGRPTGLVQATIGPYTIHRRPPPPRLRVTGTARPGASVALVAGGFQPGEIAGLWLTTPDGRTIDLGQARADAAGTVSHTLSLPPRLEPGPYTLSARGALTGATGHAPLQVGP
jgi:hypothetical protein